MRQETFKRTALWQTLPIIGVTKPHHVEDAVKTAALQAFLFHYGDEMAGKGIGLIVSSASSGISGVEADAKRLIPDGNFLSPSLWIRSSQTSDCHSMIAEWLDEINYSGLATSEE